MAWVSVWLGPVVAGVADVVTATVSSAVLATELEDVVPVISGSLVAVVGSTVAAVSDGKEKKECCGFRACFHFGEL